MSVQDDERRTYDDVWGLDGYDTFSPGEHYLPIFLDYLAERGHTPALMTVLDAGVGSGKGSIAMNAHFRDVNAVDITASGLSEEFKAAGIGFTEVCLWKDVAGEVGWHDWVYCTDVLEHIPEALTMLVIHRLLSASRYGLFLSICLQPDQFGAWLGKPLHQTVRDFAWWKNMLSEIGSVDQARDLLNTGVFVVTR